MTAHLTRRPDPTRAGARARGSGGGALSLDGITCISRPSAVRASRGARRAITARTARTRQGNAGRASGAGPELSHRARDLAPS